MSIAHAPTAACPGAARPALPRADRARGKPVPRKRRSRVLPGLGPTTVSIVLHGAALLALAIFAVAPGTPEGFAMRLTASLVPDFGEVDEEQPPDLEELEVVEMEEVFELPEMQIVELPEDPPSLPPVEEEELEPLEDVAYEPDRLALPLAVATQRRRAERPPVVAPPPAPPPTAVAAPAPRPRPVAARPPPLRRGGATGGRLQPLSTPLYYPESARQSGLTGRAQVEFVVREDGSVTHVRLVASSGSPILDEAALSSVRRWRFAPPGELRRVSVPVAFRLQ